MCLPAAVCPPRDNVFQDVRKRSRARLRFFVGFGCLENGRTPFNFVPVIQIIVILTCEENRVSRHREERSDVAVCL